MIIETHEPQRTGQVMVAAKLSFDGGSGRAAPEANTLLFLVYYTVLAPFAFLIRPGR